jgi:hypothetical protein
VDSPTPPLPTIRTFIASPSFSWSDDAPARAYLTRNSVFATHS